MTVRTKRYSKTKRAELKLDRLKRREEQRVLKEIALAFDPWMDAPWWMKGTSRFPTAQPNQTVTVSTPNGPNWMSKWLP